MSETQNQDAALVQLRIDTERLMQELNSECESEHERLLRLFPSASDMLARNTEQIEYLLRPLLPRSGIAALVGSSDSGKSTLLRGLAMAIVSGARSYLGFAIEPRYRSVIYVSTEDDEDAIAALMHRQISELGTSPEVYNDLYFMFDTEELIERLDRRLELKPADVVIVDAFADLYTGPMNENNRVRSFLNSFTQLAHKHSTLFIFLHHTGKRTEALMPSKHNAIGSQGFEAKMRIMMELRPDVEAHDLRHLCVVKGNYLASEYKHDSFVLRFSAGLNFEATGERVPFELLREREPTEEDNERLQRMRKLRAEGKTFRDIGKEVGCSAATVMRNLGKNI